MTRTVLLTGAAGNVAAMLRPLLLERYGRLVLSDRREPGALQPGESFRPAELDDAGAVAAACEGVTAVVHLGGQSTEAEWERIDAANIQGMMNLLEGMRKAGAERLVFASSNHAMGMYSRQRRVGVADPVRPDSRYGLSKAFGEAAAALYADKHGLRCLSIRIGNVDERPVDLRRLSIWIHPEDLFELCVIGIEHPGLHNAIVYGASDNARSFWDNAAAFRLGYRPKHRAEDFSQAALEAQGALRPDPVGDLLQGGGFASRDFDGDLERTRWS